VIRWSYAFIDRPAADFDAACAFWTAVTATTLSARRGARDEFATLLPASGDAMLKIQAVDDAGGAHIDLSTEDVAGFTALAVGLGATTVVDHGGYAVLRSPAGQLFCCVPWHGEATRPPAATGPDATTVLDTVCVDVAEDRYEAEVAFWTALTGWPSRPARFPQFHVVGPGPGVPLRILVQRLDVARPTSAHLDLACSDRIAARERHESLGATFVADIEGWTVMRDPAGGVYCLIGRAPATGAP
jgi:hypothetical protein